MYDTSDIAKCLGKHLSRERGEGVCEELTPDVLNSPHWQPPCLQTDASTVKHGSAQRWPAGPNLRALPYGTVSSLRAWKQPSSLVGAHSPVQ